MFRMAANIMGRVVDINFLAAEMDREHLKLVDMKHADRSDIRIPTGDFSEKGLTDDISGMTYEDYAGIESWRKFYAEHKKYSYAGKLIGKFYDDNGDPTDILVRVQHGIREQEKFMELLKSQEKIFTKCNSNWSREKGGYVWCADGQYPRRAKLQKPDGGFSERCACISEDQLETKPAGSQEELKQYPNCRKKQKHCQSVRPGQMK